MRSRRDPGGRPSKFTPQAALSLVADLADGMTREHAARVAGVGASTVYRWLQKGRGGDPRFAPLVRAVKKAESGALFGRVLAEIAWNGGPRF